MLRYHHILLNCTLLGLKKKQYTIIQKDICKNFESS